MLDRVDVTFAAALEREIIELLEGTRDIDGLYKTGAINAQNWDAYQHNRGRIGAYEDVLERMKDLHRRMNEGEEPVRR